MIYIPNIFIYTLVSYLWTWMEHLYSSFSLGHQAFHNWLPYNVLMCMFRGIGILLHLCCNIWSDIVVLDIHNHLQWEKLGFLHVVTCCTFLGQCFWYDHGPDYRTASLIWTCYCRKLFLWSMSPVCMNCIKASIYVFLLCSCGSKMQAFHSCILSNTLVVRYPFHLVMIPPTCLFISCYNNFMNSKFN